MRDLLLVVVSLGAFVAAAKTHGRQLRLEREAAGYWNVTFGRENDPWVETLWRRDRIRFWAGFTGIALGVLALALGNARFVGLFEGGRGSFPWFASLALIVGLWTPIALFLALGTASVWRLRGALIRNPEAPAGVSDPALREQWRQAARRGSLGWWGLAMLLVLGVVWAAVR